MKRTMLIAERLVWRFPPIRLIIFCAEWFGARLFWLWGRMRFGARVPRRGLGCVCHWTVEIKYPENLVIGDRVIIGVNVTLGARSRITLGDDVRLSKNVQIETAGLDFSTGVAPYPHVSAPITICDGAWIGTGAVILAGVTVGRMAVVAAGAVVTSDVAPGTVVAGIPAREVKK